MLLPYQAAKACFQFSMCINNAYRIIMVLLCCIVSLAYVVHFLQCVCRALNMPT